MQRRGAVPKFEFLLSERRMFMAITTGYNSYGNYNNYNSYNNYNQYGNPSAEEQSPIRQDEDKKKKIDQDASRADCKTCENRKYKDGSDENVSFKSATHISPESAGARVRAHENEHVNNAYKKAARDNGKVLSATVSIHTAVCPECGRSYISGGTTNTMIKYTNEGNPYQKELKNADATRLRGANLNITA